jgi:hypothetical protein
MDLVQVDAQMTALQVLATRTVRLRRRFGETRCLSRQGDNLVKVGSVTLKMEPGLLIGFKL